MLYEITKGAPPYSNVDRLKLIEMLPRLKPARFAEEDASKEAREFLTRCLIESPPEVNAAWPLSVVELLIDVITASFS